MRILLVEDEEHLADSIRRGLEGEGFVVDTAADGVSGAWLAVHNPYDVIILDIMLPGKSGYEILEDVRAVQVWTPVLMLTAKDGDYDQKDAFDLGADDFLIKPFSFIVLVSRLRALARRGAPERPVNVEAGSLLLEPARRRVTRAGQVLELTPKEFAILQFLMRRHDQVVSKAEILDNAWDSDYQGSHNVVEVYIGYLRKKIDIPFGRDSLRTVRGMGYMLVSSDN